MIKYPSFINICKSLLNDVEIIFQDEINVDQSNSKKEIESNFSY
jgi:hypothetical protein